MCNIAGYAGSKRAAPVLLEMIRREQAFDGNCSTGIATIHDGKLYHRKIVGDVDTLIRETDALDLPGTIGFAHSRDGGVPGAAGDIELAHPYLSMDGEMCVVSNGTTPQDQYTPQRNAAVQKLGDAGFQFRTGTMGPSPWPRLRNGMAVGTGEVRVHLIDYYLRKGMSYAEAVAATATDLYADNVLLMMNQNAPDQIFAVRTVRPMEVLLGEGETYLATTSVAFPKDVPGGVLTSLPLMNACVITRGGVEITPYRVQGAPVGPITPTGYAIARSAVLGYLADATQENPKAGIFGAVKEKIPEIFPGDYHFTEYLRLGYEVAAQLEAEGRLCKVERPTPWKGGMRGRYYFWLK